MTMAAVMAAIQVEAAASASGTLAPTYPPESANEFPPFAVVVPVAVDTEVESINSSFMYEHYKLQVHYPRANPSVAEAVEASVPFGEAFITRLVANPTLSGAVKTAFRENLHADYGSMQYAGIDTIGWSFDIFTSRML